MILPAARHIIGCGQNGIVLLILAMVMTAPRLAGVGLPAMPDSKDTNAMAAYRVQVFYEAQKSEQARLKVGQERYSLMLTNRAHVLQAMAAQFAAREQAVDIPPSAPDADFAKNKQPDTWLVTTIGVAAIGLCCFGFRSYLNRQNLKDAVSQKY